MSRKTGLSEVIRGIRLAFPSTLPVFFGWIFVALTYGVLMNKIGYNFLWTMLFSALCFCGSMQIAAVPMISSGFDPLQMLIMSYLVNFRHTFYGIPLLETYKDTKPFRAFMIYTLSDEQFSLSVTEKCPEGIDKKYFYFGINLLCFVYWVGLCGLGGLIGELIKFNTAGLDFALNAMFISLFMQHWKEKDNRKFCLIGISVTLASLLIFGKSVFLIPALLSMLLIFWLGRDRW